MIFLHQRSHVFVKERMFFLKNNSLHKLSFVGSGSVTFLGQQTQVAAETSSQSEAWGIQKLEMEVSRSSILLGHFFRDLFRRVVTPQGSEK